MVFFLFSEICVVLLKSPASRNLFGLKRAPFLVARANEVSTLRATDGLYAK